MRLTPLMLQKELLMLTEEQRQDFLYEATNKIFHFTILGCGCELEKRPNKQCHCNNDE